MAKAGRDEMTGFLKEVALRKSSMLYFSTLCNADLGLEAADTSAFCIFLGKTDSGALIELSCNNNNYHTCNAIICRTCYAKNN